MNNILESIEDRLRTDPLGPYRVGQLTEAQILEETVRYYSADVKRRSEYRHLNRYCCAYYYYKLRNMCSIGRCLRSPREFEYRFGAKKISDINREAEDLDEYFKPEYRGHDIRFWTDLQKLHDDDDNWGEEGLSKQGEEFVEKMKVQWCD